MARYSAFSVLWAALSLLKTFTVHAYHQDYARSCKSEALQDVVCYLDVNGCR